MGTGNEPQRNPAGQPTPPPSGQKPDKGSGRYEEENARKAQLGKGNPPPSHAGKDPKRMSDKMNDAGKPDPGDQGRSSPDR